MQKQTHTTGKSNKFLKKNTMEKTFTNNTESVYQVRAILDIKMAKLYDYLDENEKYRSEIDRESNPDAYSACLREAAAIRNKIGINRTVYAALGDLLMEMHALGE